MKAAFFLTALIFWAPEAHAGDPPPPGPLDGRLDDRLPTALTRLTTSNGHGAAVYDLTTRRLTDFWPAIYRTESAGRDVPELLYDAYLGVRLGGVITWLTDVPILTAGYEAGTNIIHVRQSVEGRTVDAWYYSPWAAEGPAFAYAVQIDGGPGATIVSLHNLHIGRPTVDGDVGAEEVRPLGNGAVREAGDRFTVVHRPLVAPIGLAVPPNNPFRLGPGSNFPPPGDVELTVSDDAVIGFEFAERSGDLTIGAAVIGVGVEGDSLTLDDERRQWSVWQASLRGVRPPADGFERQQAAFIRMAQVRTAGGGQGQILASLPPGIWNIAWVRDMAYATAALARIGALEEAWAALRFQLEANAGQYVDYVGRPYLISVTRYFGDGTEETDFNANGPNIEWDDFGLFLWSMGHYLDAGGDINRLAPYWPRIEALVLEVIESLIDELDLLVADSSIWERHWMGGDLDDGQRQRFAYSNIVNAAGLCHAAAASERLGVDGERWRNLARRLRRGLLTQMVTDDGVLGSSLEQVERGSGFHDLAVVEAFTLGLIAPDDAVSASTWDALTRALRVGPGRGFKRNDDGESRGGGPGQAGFYDEQEWVFLDLRTEVWRRAAGLVGPDLFAGLRVLAADAAGVLPELLTPEGARYEGAMPMVGFGAGAYLLSRDAVPERFCLGGEASPDAGLPATDAAVGLDAAVPLDASGRSDASGQSDASGRSDASGGAFDAGLDGSTPGDAHTSPDALGPPQDALRSPTEAGPGGPMLESGDRSGGSGDGAGSVHCGCSSGGFGPLSISLLLLLLGLRPSLSRRQRS